VADVCGKLMNTFADLKSVKLSETGNFKMLVSGDTISGDHKFDIYNVSYQIPCLFYVVMSRIVTAIRDN
jgi:hypothetical protein